MLLPNSDAIDVITAGNGSRFRSAAGHINQPFEIEQGIRPTFSSAWLFYSSMCTFGSPIEDVVTNITIIFLRWFTQEAFMAVDKFPIEAGHIMLFARSIGDANPIYYDAEHAKETEAGAVIAPPTFVQASAQFDPDYFLRPKIGEEWFGSAKGPTGITKKEGSGGGGGGGGGLHAEQHYVYHKPLKAGDVLTATTKPGNSWEKEGRRGGKLMFSESVTEYRDQSGDLVVTATSVGVRTERPATTS
jgi:hypothetical protein